MRLRCVRPVLVAAAAAVGGCYEVAHFFPSGGQGSVVTDGRSLGVASRLTGDEADGTEGQAYLVLSVGEAYTADVEEGGGGTRAIIPIVAKIVNETDTPVRFEAKAARLEVQGRIFGPKWTYRDPEAADDAFDTVDAGVVAGYQMYFDLGAYMSPSRRGPDAGAGPHASKERPAEEEATSEGLPLGAIRQLTLTWKGAWGGQTRSGKAVFTRDWSGHYPPAALGPYWGGGWYVWADPWPARGVIFATRLPRYRRPAYRFK